MYIIYIKAEIKQIHICKAIHEKIAYTNRYTHNTYVKKTGVLVQHTQATHKHEGTLC